MEFYRELEAYQKLNIQIRQMNNIIRQLTSQSDKTSGATKEANNGKIIQLRSTVELLMGLRNKLNTLYTPYRNNPKRYRTMNGAEVEELKIYYSLCKDFVRNLMNTLYPNEKQRNSKVADFLRDTEATLQRDEQLVRRFKAENGLSLPGATFRAYAETISDPKNHRNAQYKWPGFFEYESLFLSNPKVSHEDALRMYNRKSAEEIRREYQQKVSSEPRFYEYPRTRNRIDPKIRNTGNAEKINQYLAEDDAKENEADKLTFRERQMLIHHRDASAKVKTIQDSVKPAMQAGNELGAKPAFLRNDKGGVVLDVHQPRFQSSANGCWSCSGAMLAGSRGIARVTQEDIRNYRPDIGEEEIVTSRGDLDENYNYDSVKSIAENADSILQHAPNSMLHSLTIDGYSDETQKDYTLNEYIRNTEELLKKQINHALRVDRSPVSFLQPGHYITIVGMEENEVLYKDSYKGEKRTEPADHTFRAPLKTLIKDNFLYEGGPAPIEISWLSDIKLAQDGKTIHGVPSEYVYMKEDGSVTQQPLALRESMGIFDNNPISRIGVRVGRPAEDEDQVFSMDRGNKYSSSGVSMMENVYLPKQLNANYLKTMAGKRSAEEEAKLSAADREIFHIKEGKKDPEQAEAEFRRRMEVIANEKKAEPEPINLEKEDEIDTTSPEKKIIRSEEPIKRKPASPLDVERMNRLIKEKKLIARKERLRAEELKKDHSFTKIADAADTLLEKMNRNKHFYLLLANPAYKNVIRHLEQIRLLSRKAAAQDPEDPFTDEDAEKLVKAIDNGAREAKKYLSDKQEEMERDPRRRNNPGKMKYEQPRIDATLDVYDALSEMSLSLRARENTKDILYLDEKRKSTVNHFIRELTSDLADPAVAQKKSEKNRLYLPEHTAAGMNRLESLFGTVPSKKKKLRIVGKDEVLSDSGSYKAIGGTEEMLSQKDYAALAIAASTTPEALNNDHKAAVPEKKISAADNQAYHAGDTLHGVIRGGTEELSALEPNILKSKGLASKALLDYEQGNPDTLAKLIANGIKNLNDMYIGGKYAGEKEMELYIAEMGLRLKGMLERDPRLMEKAMGYGVTPKMLKDLKDHGVAAEKGVLAAKWSSKENLARGENWGIREKERNYVDLLMNRYLEEERERMLSGSMPKGADPKEVQYAKQLAHIKQTPATGSISNAGKENELKDRIRAYIRGNRYLDYSPKEFLEAVVGSREKPATERTSPLLVDLAAFESRQKLKPSAKRTLNSNARSVKKDVTVKKGDPAVTAKKPKGPVPG